MKQTDSIIALIESSNKAQITFIWAKPESNSFSCKQD